MNPLDVYLEYLLHALSAPVAMGLAWSRFVHATAAAPIAAPAPMLPIVKGGV